MLTRHSGDIRRLLAFSAALLALTAFAPLVLAESSGAPLQQATATPTLSATVVPAGTPSTLPATGGEETDAARWAPVLIVAVGLLVVLIVANFAAESRADNQ